MTSREPTQAGMFPTANDVARHTRKSADERAWERERRARSKKTQSAPIPDSGPCCGRCRHWRKPLDAKTAYGECRIRVVTTARVPNVIEKGVCLERDPWTHELMEGPDRPLGAFVAVEPMHCGPAFACRSYDAAGEGWKAA